MFARAGFTSTARRTALVAAALFVSLVAALIAEPAAVRAAPAHHVAHHVTLRQHSTHTAARKHSTRKLTTRQVIANSLRTMLNKERHAHGLRPLTMNSDLVKSAHAHNLAMARRNLMSHQEAGEASLATRISRTGYKWSWAGENIGWNSQMNKSGVLRLESMMYHEKAPNDGHRLNILNKHFKNIGVDVYMDKSHKKVWLTTDFGRH